MSTIQCQDKFLPPSDLTEFGNVLKDNHSLLQTPVNCSNPTTSKRTGITFVLVLDPVVEFDETEIDREKVVAIMESHGFQERK